LFGPKQHQLINMNKKNLPWMGALFGLLLSVSGLQADHHEAADLNVGDKAPEFTAIDQDGHLWKTSSLKGEKNLVVYFYPAAMTGGCTKQACAFRDDASKLKDLDTVVVGVSGDAPAGLKVFQQTHDLNFDLLADYNGAIAKAFGVPLRDGGTIERQFLGKAVSLERGVTASRWTFVINKEGKVIYKNTKVEAAQDSANVIAVLSK
jgi:peroxiredoxin Q/BCP